MDKTVFLGRGARPRDSCGEYAYSYDARTAAMMPQSKLFSISVKALQLQLCRVLLLTTHLSRGDY